MDAQKWLFDKLSQDAELSTKIGERIFADVAPEGTEFPFVVLTLVDMTPAANAYADSIFDTERWDVKVIDKSKSFKNAREIAERIRALLHKQSAPEQGIQGAKFEMKRQFSQDEKGAIYRTIVQEFEIYTQTE